MTKDADKNRMQIQYFCMNDLVPEDHLLRLIEEAIDWGFIYDLVEDKYCPDWGRPSMDPVTLIKIPFIQYLYGIRSMRQTIKEIEVNVAYRWFLGLDMYDPVPHFTTFGKNYTRRFKDTDLFEQIFSRILDECYKNAKKLLSKHETLVLLIADELMERETITREQIKELVETGKIKDSNEKKQKEEPKKENEETKKETK